MPGKKLSQVTDYEAAAYLLSLNGDKNKQILSALDELDTQTARLEVNTETLAHDYRNQLCTAMGQIRAALINGNAAKQQDNGKEVAESIEDMRKALSEIRDLHSSLESMVVDDVAPEELGKTSDRIVNLFFDHEYEKEAVDKLLETAGPEQTGEAAIAGIKDRLEKPHVLLNLRDELTRVIAIRQLTRGGEGTHGLQENTCTEGQIELRKNQLLADSVYQEFLDHIAGTSDENIRPLVESITVKKDKGASLDDSLKKYIQARPDYEHLNWDLYAFYQIKSPYQSYTDYMAQKKCDFVQKWREDPMNLLAPIFDDRIAHAAKMAAAYALGGKEKQTNTPFNPNQHRKMAGRFFRDPIFKITVAKEENISAANKGEMQNFFISYGDVKSSFDQIDLTGDRIEALRAAYLELVKAHRGPEASDAYVKSRSAEFQAMAKETKAFLDKWDAHTDDPADPKKPLPTATDAARVFSSVLDYQEGKEKVRFFTSGQKRFESSAKIMSALTIGTAAEKFMRDQTAKINKIREAKAGDEDYLDPGKYTLEVIKAGKPELIKPDKPQKDIKEPVLPDAGIMS